MYCMPVTFVIIVLNQMRASVSWVFFFSFSSFTFLDTNLWPISLTLCSAFAVCLVWLRALYWPVSGHTAGAKPSQDG